MVTRIGSVEWIAAFAVAAAWAAWLLASDAGSITYALTMVPAAISLVGFGLVSVVQGRRYYVLGLLALVTIVPALNFRAREIGTVGLDWQNGLKLGLWIMLLGVCVAAIASYMHLLRDRALLAFVFFAGFAVLSSLYSPVPVYSAACAFGMLAYLLFTTLTAARCRGCDILPILCYGLAVYLAAGWIWASLIPERAFLAPHQGDEGYRLLGLSSHPNMLAVEAACLLCAIIPAAVRGFLDRRLAWALGLVGAVTILAAGSRTTAVAVAVSAGTVLLRQRRASPVILLLPIACTAGYALLFGLGLAPRLDVILGSVSRSGDASEILTLTGRTELWAFVWDKFTDRPLFGYGFNSAETVLSRDWYGNADAGYNAHNVVLQALLTMGIVGTTPLLVALTVLVYRWFTVREQSLSSYLIPYVLILGATEAHIAAMPTLITLLLFLSIGIDVAERQAPGNLRGDNGYR